MSFKKVNSKTLSLMFLALVLLVLAGTIVTYPEQPALQALFVLALAILMAVEWLTRRPYKLHKADEDEDNDHSC